MFSNKSLTDKLSRTLLLISIAELVLTYSLLYGKLPVGSLPYSGEEIKI